MLFHVDRALIYASDHVTAMFTEWLYADRRICGGVINHISSYQRTRIYTFLECIIDVMVWSTDPIFARDILRLETWAMKLGPWSLWEQLSRLCEVLCNPNIGYFSCLSCWFYGDTFSKILFSRGLLALDIISEVLFELIWMWADTGFLRMNLADSELRAHH